MFARLALVAALAAIPVTAATVDPETRACALAHAVPTDENIEACTGAPVDLAPARTFAFLASFYERSGPVIFILGTSLSGAECIARMEHGFTYDDALAVIDERVTPIGEGHVPASAYRPALARAVLSCEFDL